MTSGHSKAMDLFLLRFPPEVRNKIYEYAATEEFVLYPAAAHCQIAVPPPHLVLGDYSEQVKKEFLDYLIPRKLIIFPITSNESIRDTYIAVLSHFSDEQRAMIRTTEFTWQMKFHGRHFFFNTQRKEELFRAFLATLDFRVDLGFDFVNKSEFHLQVRRYPGDLGEDPWFEYDQFVKEEDLLTNQIQISFTKNLRL
ncbi:MAG: hypothetical protein M1820_006263 [Bogoriella megaspora]|nr:MAG: hypothetical protein M1820_006263 [Bogoriella megaspora]